MKKGLLLLAVLVTLFTGCSDEDEWAGQCIWASNTNPSVSESVDFATDCYEDVEEYEWDFGDGNNLKNASATVSHSFTKTGSHKVKIKVKTKSGTDKNSEITVTVS